MNKILIGIDCDVDKSGVAVMENNVMSIHKLGFFELFDYLVSLNVKNNYTSFHKMFNSPTSFEDSVTKVKVFLEAGWLNLKSNWHVSGHGERVSARIGTKVGANHQVGKLIAEMCEYLGIEYELVQPRTSKYTIKQFRMMSGYKGKLDQDMVDSALLILNRV